jgi:hypothetical protein
LICKLHLFSDNFMIDILLRIEPKHNKIHIHDYLAVTPETENSCTNVAGKATSPDKLRRSHAAVHAGEGSRRRRITLDKDQVGEGSRRRSIRWSRTSEQSKCVRSSCECVNWSRLGLEHVECVIWWLLLIYAPTINIWFMDPTFGLWILSFALDCTPVQRICELLS